jgi:hypothetical protein
MKVYNLRCEQEHPFEGWFSSEDDFNRQLHDKHIRCPLCDSAVIIRLPSAPRLNLSGAESAAGKGEQIQAAFVDTMRQLVANTEDVGERFADEARRIHYNEAPERAIRGVASAEQYEALTEEGIEVTLLPLPVLPKGTLQ